MKKWLKVLLVALVFGGAIMPKITVRAEEIVDVDMLSSTELEEYDEIQEVTEDSDVNGAKQQQSGNYKYIVLPNGTVEITEYIYNGVDENIIIADTIDGRKVTSIGNNAFMGCRGFNEVTIPDSVTNIGDSAFASCTTLGEVIIPSSVTSIGIDAFSGCNYVVIHCKLDSVAEAYAIANNLSYNNLSLCDITLAETIVIYDGSYIQAVVTIKDGNKTLKGGTDYTIESSGFVSKDHQLMTEEKIVIIGTGSYVGTIVKKIEIIKADHYTLDTHRGEWDGTYYYLGLKISDYFLYKVKMTDIFFSDGTYTYYLQADGTPMKDSLTYHPDGVHLIYFNENGQELFNRFQYCADVGYTCYFDTFGYLYKDQITFYDDKPYYLDGTGRMKQNEYFKFDNGVDIGHATADGSLENNGFGYDQYGRVVFYHWNGMIARGLITDGVWYYHMDETDGHLLGKFIAR